MERTGVWIVGAYGSLATTLVAGARAIARGFAGPSGLLTERAEFARHGWTPIGDLVFGGTDIRPGDVEVAAREALSATGAFSEARWAELAPDLAEVTQRVRRGTARGCGPTIERLATGEDAPLASPRAQMEAIATDLRAFQQETGVTRTVVVNLASTEPPVGDDAAYATLDEFERALDGRSVGELRAGALYAYAAFTCGAAFVNFTPSGSSLSPALEAFATARDLPYMGNDGKTGETLVKSALAPMFRHRGLTVDSWVGFNILGNRDGEVLADGDNKQSKVETKDSVLPSILGYPLETKVGIDYVQSLGDRKVAWDHIHFRGFLDVPMAMEFTWRGWDSILAAPLVLDLVRFMDRALRLEHAGPQVHLAAFFKDPMHGTEHDLHRQIAMLEQALAEGGGAGAS